MIVAVRSPNPTVIEERVAMEVEEDEEEEDVDFDPFHKEGTPSEPSSGSSSDDNDESGGAKKYGVLLPPAPVELRGEGNDEDPGLDLFESSFELELETHRGSALLNGSPQKIVGEGNEEDAIFRRTRARQSLAHHTLDELEAFLQDSDDEEPQNTEDVAEYRKFLAAVLLEGNDDGGPAGGRGEDEYNDDEENDADFELEIEEALESDADEYLETGRRCNEPKERAAKLRRQETRRKKELTVQPTTSFRPILPHTSRMCIAPLPPFIPHFSPFQGPISFGSSHVQGFMPHQVSRLYCLLYEHVQLLIQVYSLCAFDPSKKQIAKDTHKMILEMIGRKEEALAWKKSPYPGFCFRPDNLFSSEDPHFNQTGGPTLWKPSVQEPVLSILDVTPLRLASDYLTDVSDAVEKYSRQIYVKDGPGIAQLKREPLFLLPSCEIGNEVLGETNVLSATGAASVSPRSSMQQQPKKTLAATLVESSMKQPVAEVFKCIANLAQRFYVLFNPALFPHKAPVAAVSNRVLFTDAEDRLLAMGMMEYNCNWEAIQQRYLPCKSEHQIFVRQKNRSSSKAPENPIKAVRHMKTAALTADEKARIDEGLKRCNNNWFKVCKYFVPHRDPSLLPRQWRIASGTQKSYKKSEADRVRRREYEAKRKLSKAKAKAKALAAEEVHIEGDNVEADVEVDEEPSVHEAYLAEVHSGRTTKTRLSDISQASCIQTYHGTQAIEMGISCSNQQVPDNSMIIGGKYPCSSNLRTSKLGSATSIGHVTSIPSFPHKNQGIRLAKVAPDLPLVNLPPSGRVISHSAFKTHLNRISVPKVCRQHDGDAHVNQFPPVEDNSAEPVLEMHPLPSQASEGCSSYNLSSGARGSSSACSFFPMRSPTRTNLDLLDPKCPLRPSKGALSSSGTIDSHPLLHSSNGSQPPRGKKELDLNINLPPPMPRKRRTGNRIDLHHQSSNISCAKKGNREQSRGDELLQVPASSTDAAAIASVGTFACQYHGSGFGEESTQEIIMEQEELSDSDEGSEIVEFEREEMDDSEAEG